MGVSKTPTRHISRECGNGTRWIRADDGAWQRLLPDPTRHPRPRSGTLRWPPAGIRSVRDPRRPIGNGNRRPRPNPPSPTRIRHPRPRSGTYGARCAGTPRPPVRPKTVTLSVYRGTRSALILNVASGAAAALHPLGNRVRRGTRISGRYQS